MPIHYICGCTFSEREPRDGAQLEACAFHAAMAKALSESLTTLSELQDKATVAEGDKADAARYRWWQRWWCNAKDDMERINSMEYDGDDPASMNEAIDAEIARDAK